MAGSNKLALAVAWGAQATFYAREMLPSHLRFTANMTFRSVNHSTVSRIGVSLLSRGEVLTNSNIFSEPQFAGINRLALAVAWDAQATF